MSDFLDTSDCLVNGFFLAQPLAGNSSPMTLATRLAALLEKRGWSARQCARVAGLKSETHVSHLLQGGDPRLSTLVAVADALETSVEYLATGNGPQQAKVNRRDLAAKLAREAGIDPRAIDLVAKQEDNSVRSTIDWIDQMRLAELMLENSTSRAAVKRPK